MLCSLCVWHEKGHGDGVQGCLSGAESERRGVPRGVPEPKSSVGVHWPGCAGAKAFVCPSCGHRFPTRRPVYQRNRCKKQTSFTAGTIIFHLTKLPLTAWFVAIHLIMTEKNGISSVELGWCPWVRRAISWYIGCGFGEGVLDGGSLRIARFDLTDDEWSVIVPLLPNKPRGVPRVDDRRVLNVIFYILHTGSPWRDLPAHYSPYTTVYNRHNRWAKQGGGCASWRRCAPKRWRPFISSTLRSSVPTNTRRTEKRGMDHAIGRSRGGLSTKQGPCSDR